ncbi:hypothetical protein BH24BAC1_BH24BAC1_14960 [soil metagenome]
MKKFLLLVLSAVGFSFPAFPQTEKGSKMIGGTMYLATSAHQGSGFLQFGLNPQLGFFVADHFAVGPGLSFSAFSYGDQRGIGYGVSPFARYSFGSSPARLFLSGGAGIGGNRTSSLDYVQTYRTTHVRFGPGLTYFLNEFVGLDGVLTYDLNKYQGEPASRALNLNVGVQVFLPWQQ